MNRSSIKKSRKKIMLVFGTRPEAIKLAPIALNLKEHPHLECIICITAQHREMIDQVLSIFGIVPEVDLNLMRPNQHLADLTAMAIKGLYRVFLDMEPDLVLVQGDTTTVFCASLAAFYCDIPVGHVEAGLRTGDLNAPWPEEANRVLTSRLALFHFAPTDWARDNLLREGVQDKHVYVTGNTVVDALHYTLEKYNHLYTFSINGIGDIAELTRKARIVLITGHRRESFGEDFKNICLAIGELADKFPEIHFVYPVHLNPNVRKPVDRILRQKSRWNLHLIDPIPYVAFVHLMNSSYLILTDSGGIQEEAPSLGKPVLVMRNKTERPEGILAGTARLVSTSRERIVTEVTHLLTEPDAYQAMVSKDNPYGDGKASARIIQVCEEFLLRC